MIGLLQRVVEASVEIQGQTVAAIDRGVLVLVGIRPADDSSSALKLLERCLKYRIFSDDAGKMTMSLQDIGGGLLLVPQFTLAADTRQGLRPSFSTAAPAERARDLFAGLVREAEARHPHVGNGRFGADMRIALINDGPVTFWLES